MNKTILFLLCALLSFQTAHADTQVAILPTLPPPVSVAVDASPYLTDLTSYYEDVVEWQQPSLTDEEKARIPVLLSRYQQGERPTENVFGKTENVSVGVYALDPADYQGECAYVLLPVRLLTDDELLGLIDAFAQLDLSFDTDSLSWRNCARGGAMNCTRGDTAEERERVKTLTALYQQQGLRPEHTLSPLPSDGGLGFIGTAPKDAAHITEFLFVPYRSMTDEELLERIQHKIGEDVPDQALMDQYERQTRQQLTALLGAPLSLKLVYESLRAVNDATVSANGRTIYTSAYHAASSGENPLVYWTELDTETGLLYWADAQPMNWEALPDSDLRCDLNDEKWLTIARNLIAALRTDDVQIVEAKTSGEHELDYGGYCVSVSVTMTDGSCYAVLIPYQTERMFNLNYWQNADAREHH